MENKNFKPNQKVWVYLKDNFQNGGMPLYYAAFLCGIKSVVDGENIWSVAITPSGPGTRMYLAAKEGHLLPRTDLIPGETDAPTGKEMV